jgi:hypothetical protein
MDLEAKIREILSGMGFNLKTKKQSEDENEDEPTGGTNLSALETQLAQVTQLLQTEKAAREAAEKKATEQESEASKTRQLSKLTELTKSFHVTPAAAEKLKPLAGTDDFETVLEAFTSNGKVTNLAGFDNDGKVGDAINAEELSLDGDPVKDFNSALSQIKEKEKCNIDKATELLEKKHPDIFSAYNEHLKNKKRQTKEDSN